MKTFAKNFCALFCCILLVIVSATCTSDCSAIAVAAAAATPATIELPILMYHKVAKSHPTKYVVTTEQLTADFQALHDAGYTPVFLREVTAWVNGTGELPERPVVITFDDGQYNNLCYVLPIAQKFNFKYEINPVTAYSEKSMHDHDTTNPRYSNLSWDALREANASGLIEIGNHSHNLHRTSPRYGVGQKRGESLAEYTQVLHEDIGHAQDLLTACGIPAPTVFAYPFGKYSSSTREILLEMGFNVLLTCNEHTNTITQGDPTCLHSLGRFNRSGNATTTQIMKKING